MAMNTVMSVFSAPASSQNQPPSTSTAPTRFVGRRHHATIPAIAYSNPSSGNSATTQAGSIGSTTTKTTSPVTATRERHRERDKSELQRR